MDIELKQYFDQRFEKVDQRFNKIDSKLKQHDDQFSKIDGRFEKLEQGIDIKIDSAVESLARIIATTVAEPLECHIEETRDYPTVRKDVSMLKHDVSEIKKVLHLKS